MVKKQFITKAQQLFIVRKNKDNCMLVSEKGFTLVEVLIAVAIVGILGAIAYPSYVSFVLTSDRTEGQRELLRLANLQEQVFIDRRSYTADMTQLGMNADPFITESTKYSIDAVTANSGATYVLTATAKGSQLNDTGCTALTINEVGLKSPEACWR